LKTQPSPLHESGTFDQRSRRNQADYPQFTKQNPGSRIVFAERLGSFDNRQRDFGGTMLKKFMIGAALSAFAVSSAFAQAANPSTDPPANSQQQMQSGAGGGSQMKPSSTPTTSVAPAPAATMGSGPNKAGTTDDSLKAGTTDKPASTGR
jgi:hypothetical protein